MNKETIIQNEIRCALSPYGVVLRLNNGLVYSKDGRPLKIGLPKGTPDLLFVGNGFVAWLEVKTDKGRATEAQYRFLERMQALGHKAGIVRSVEDALRLIGGGTA